jgi:hypothetical protein
MMECSRHKSMDTLRGYIRKVDMFKEHAGPPSCERHSETNPWDLASCLG